MAFTIDMLTALETTKNFKLIAGKKGLSRVIDSVEILDFEFDIDGEGYRKSRLFEGNSLVLTSFMYAKGKPELITDSIRRLMDYNVQALAYKPVLFQELPKEAIQIANNAGFPIFEFEEDSYMENIIIEVGAACANDRNETFKENMLESIISGSNEGSEMMASIADPMGKYLTATFIKLKDAEELIPKLRLQRRSDMGGRRVFFSFYRDTMAVLMASDRKDPSAFQDILEDVCLSLGLSSDQNRSATFGWSSLSSDRTKSAELTREAFWSLKIAEIERKNCCCYDEIGIWKLIARRAGDPFVVTFAKEYLTPILEEAELIATATEYVLSGGDMGATAESLYVHKNTIRYRLGKIKEKLDPAETEEDFYANLSVAMKIYLLNK